MKHSHPYIVLEPGMRTNATGKHLVVHVNEWTAIVLREKADYTFSIACDDYSSAAVVRDRRNHKPEEFFTQRKTGISLAREKETIA